MFLFLWQYWAVSMNWLICSPCQQLYYRIYAIVISLLSMRTWTKMSLVGEACLDTFFILPPDFLDHVLHERDQCYWYTGSVYMYYISIISTCLYNYVINTSLLLTQFSCIICYDYYYVNINSHLSPPITLNMLLH